MRIPLFDIDWTLIPGGYEHDRPHWEAYDVAFRDIYHVPIATIHDITPHGMVDIQIVVEILRRHGHPEEQTKSQMQQAVVAMETYFQAHIGEGNYMPLAGAVRLLSDLRDNHVPMGLLTGNIERIARSKLAAAGLDQFFLFGAFGDQAYQRVALIPIAVQRACEALQSTLSLTDFVIVGDSPLDVACAKTGGIPVIAVASGKYSSAQLRDAGADIVIASLTEQEPILEFLAVR